MDSNNMLPVMQLLQVLSGSHQSPDDILRDVCDGSIFAENAVLCDNDKALQIIGYFDEFTLTNPLMSRSKKYKIGNGIHNFVANCISEVTMGAMGAPAPVVLQQWGHCLHSKLM